ncbi:uncharacterized protein [Onthophagus taurus]|uniref:uncharacterized protein n=1 Tax=Onthophagus taurus TaxID=166361 RepID=UPI0039BDAC8C
MISVSDTRFVTFLFISVVIPFSTSSWLDELKRTDDNKWQGKWFPMPPNQKNDTNPIVSLEELHDDKHGIKMGVSSANCDNAQVNLEVDWLDDATNYTCYENKQSFLPNENVRALFSQDYIPKEYSAPHKCMTESINYSHYIPTFGAHRPLWAKYGEYEFVPKQRWLHNLEHGAIVMLYHPCANYQEVNYLKDIVTTCLYRHVITPYNLLTQERPLALVSWGRRLEMSMVDPKIVINFIKTFAKHGPERTHKDGQYGYKLLKASEPPLDVSDSIVCARFQDAEM